MNFSPWAHPYNGKRTDIFSMEDSLVIMESYQVFLLFVFNTVARTHLCSQAVQNQVMALYGGKSAFREYVKAQPDKFFSALNDSFQTCCHPEFLLNAEEATYYAIDGADENGRYILIPEIFGTNDLNFRKKVRRRNGKRTMTQFHTMEAIDELYLRKCSTKTCTNLKAGPYMNCRSCLVSYLGYN